MPIDNNPRLRTTTSKPLTPALSSNLRARPAHGLTPRLAGTHLTSPASAPSRILRQQTLSPGRNEEQRSFASSLNINITPRSGARTSRYGTESPSTPDTAARARTETIADSEDSSNSIFGLVVPSPLPTPTQTRPNSTGQLSLLPAANARRVSGTSPASSAKDESKFFRVNDVKTSSAGPGVDGTRPKSTHFSRAPSPRVSPKRLNPDGREKPDGQFFYANNLPDQQTNRPTRPTLAMKLSAASTTSSSTRPPRVQAHSSISSNSRPPLTGVSANPVRNVPIQNTRQRSSSNATSAASSATDRRRSSSLNLNSTTVKQDNDHRKSPSGTSTKGNLVEPKMLAVNPTLLEQSIAEDEVAPLVCGSSTATQTLHSVMKSRSTSLVSANTTLTSTTDTAPKSEVEGPKPPQTRPGHKRGISETTVMQPVTKEQVEAANNARRERKVLDLEISNSSLLAINRTLEKELRKQNTELRRFRRLSRSGRLSLTPANRIVSGASIFSLSTLEEADHDSSQLSPSSNSSDSEAQEDEDEIFSDDNSSFTESSDVLRRRARDEKRLMQDLQRHQQILIDSQKLTQSIQRCLNVSEEMIKDGNKALAYQVQESEVKIGGRVLTHDDDEALSEVDFDEYREGMSKPRQGLLSPTVTKDALEEAAMWFHGLQTLDASNERKEITESPPSTLELSPVVLPTR